MLKLRLLVTIQVAKPLLCISRTPAATSSVEGHKHGNVKACLNGTTFATDVAVEPRVLRVVRLGD